MRRTLMLLVALCLSACAQAPKAAIFTPPDGRWWLAASADERDGFDVGFVECKGFMLHQPVAATSRESVEQAITDFYHSHPADMALQVVTVIAKLEEEWKRAGTHQFVYVDPKKDEYDGDMWWQGFPHHGAQRDGMIRGFLACQESEGTGNVSVKPDELVRRVSSWYGMDPYQDSATDLVRLKAHINDKLGPVIITAEKQKP